MLKNLNYVALLLFVIVAVIAASCLEAGAQAKFVHPLSAEGISAVTEIDAVTGTFDFIDVTNPLDDSEITDDLTVSTTKHGTFGAINSGTSDFNDIDITANSPTVQLIESDNSNNTWRFFSNAGFLFLENDTADARIRIRSFGNTDMFVLDTSDGSIVTGGDAVSSAQLHVKSGESGATPNASADDFFFENNADVGGTFAVDGVTGDQAFIRYASSTDNEALQLYNFAANRFEFWPDDGTGSPAKILEINSASPELKVSGVVEANGYNTVSSALGDPDNPYPHKEIKHPDTGEWITTKQEVIDFIASQPKDGRNYDWRWSKDYQKWEAQNDPEITDDTRVATDEVTGATEVVVVRSANEKKNARSRQIEKQGLRVHRSPIAELTPEKYQVMGEDGTPRAIRFSEQVYNRIEELENRIAELEARQ